MTCPKCSGRNEMPHQKFDPSWRRESCPYAEHARQGIVFCVLQWVPL